MYLMAYSVSKIQQFKRCPHAYELRYLCNANCETSEALTRGSEIHEKFEIFNESDETVSNFLKTKLGQKYKKIIKESEHEVKIGLKLHENKLIPCDFDDEECLFHGIIDVLSDKNIILDYKTGKYHEVQDWSQLSWYSIWYFLKNPNVESVYIGYLYVDQDKENTKILYKKDLNELIKSLVINIKEIKNTTVYNANESYLCNYCAVRKSCVYWMF